MKKLMHVSALLLPAALMAHPGHGPVENGMAHYVLSPIHLVGVAALVTLGVVLYRHFKSTSKQNA